MYQEEINRSKKIEKQALVSIGVPTYNRPGTLKRALDSLVKQTYRNLEIIVSDNCSTDLGVEQVINEYRHDGRVRFIRQLVNKGPVFNFNQVLLQSSGDYFMWLADDDWLDLNYVEVCLEFLTGNADYAAAYGMAKMYSSDEKFEYYDAPIDLSQNSGSERIACFLENVKYNGCFSALIRMNYKSQLFLENIIATDWVVVSRIAFCGKYKMLNTTNKHISQGGMSSTIDSLTSSMPVFTRCFPSLAIATNLAKDILGKSGVYKSNGFLKRMDLARQSFLIICRKFDVRNQIKPGVKKYLTIKKSTLKLFLTKKAK